MNNLPERQRALKASLEERVLVLDGAMGTMIHQAPLSIETDYQGRENCPEILNVTRPDVIQDIHRQYLEAGADIIETNTFGGTRIALADNHLEDRAYEFNFAAAKLAREIAARYSTPDKPRFVAGSIGPTNKDLNITGSTTFPEIRDAYYEQAKGLVDGGADYLLVETCFDTGSLKAGLVAV
jgi:5-methyltetrahydrofolate--homocysteine methyltransferase